jgi:hypothetical protein
LHFICLILFMQIANGNKIISLLKFIVVISGHFHPHFFLTHQYSSAELCIVSLCLSEKAPVQHSIWTPVEKWPFWIETYTIEFRPRSIINGLMKKDYLLLNHTGWKLIPLNTDLLWLFILKLIMISSHWILIFYDCSYSSV